MSFYTLLKDLFWRDQFVAGATVRMDRDRYFLVLSMLFACYGAINTGYAYVLPPSAYGVESVERMYSALQVIWAFYGLGIVADPLMVLLHVLLARRLFGKWLMLPVGVINFIIMSAIPAISTELMQDHPRGLGSVGLWLAGIFGLWLLGLVYAGFQPGLARVQPQHPLLRLNPAFTRSQQLNAVQFMWYCIGASLLAFVLLLAGLLLSFDPYSHRSLDLMLGWSLVITLLLLALLIWLLVKRLRNLDWNRWLAMGLGVMLPLVFGGLWILAYQTLYFGSLTFFVIFCLLLPWFRLAMAGFQLLVLLKPAPGAFEPEAQPVASQEPGSPATTGPDDHLPVG